MRVVLASDTMHRLGFALVTLILSTATASADRLSMPEAVEAALSRHPLLQELVATHAQLAAEIGQIRANLKPTVAATGSTELQYVDPTDITNHVAPGITFGKEGTYNVQVAATQLVTDSGRTSAQVDTARALEQQAAINIGVSQLDVELLVVQSYLSALESTDLVKVSTNAVSLVTAQLAHSQALYKTSLRPEIDVLSAKTQTAQAKLQLIADENSTASSLVTLENAIADRAPRPLELVAVEIQALPQEDQPPAELVKLALNQRADLAGLRDAVVAAEGKARLGKLRTAPIVNVSGGLFANGALSDHDAPGSVSLRPGAGAFGQLSLQWDFYIGGEDTYEVAAARAEERSAEAEVDRIEQQIMATVSQAAISVHQARDILDTVVQWRTDAERQLQVAQSRYDSNVGNFVELNDARVGLVTAQRQEVQARFGLAQARIKLARELGLRASSLGH